MDIEIAGKICVQPQWAKQDAVLVGWPRLYREWGRAFDGAKEEIAEFVRNLSKYSPVTVAVGDQSSYQEARSEIGHCSDVLEIPLGDIWLRDTTPLIGKNHEGQWVGILPNFNFWGGKFEMEGDTETAEAFCQVLGLKSMVSFFETCGNVQVSETSRQNNCNGFPLVFEGGAIEQNGQGYAILAKRCILNDNRNSSLSQESVEHWLEEVFGVNRLIWLEDGLRNDHTDGHVDNVVRFVSSNHVVCQTASGSSDPNCQLFESIKEKLEESGLKVTTIASPGFVGDENDNPLPASHLNFLISNGAVVLPTYEKIYSKQAIRSLEQIFPNHDVIGLPANNIIQGGGAFHCMTRDIPYGVLK